MIDPKNQAAIETCSLKWTQIGIGVVQLQFMVIYLGFLLLNFECVYLAQKVLYDCYL